MEMELTGRTRRLSRRASKAPLLSRLFEEGGEGSEGERKRKRKGMTMGVHKARRLEEDLGSLVLQRHRDVMSMSFSWLISFHLHACVFHPPCL